MEELVESETKLGATWLDEMLPALTRLDAILEQATTAAQQWFGADTAVDRFRGLYVSASETVRLFRRPPGSPDYAVAREQLPELNPAGTSLQRLADAYQLSDFDMDILLIALAPDLDRRYERVYAYLQDNVSLRKAGVDLILNLLCVNAIDRLQRRVHFASDAPLIRNRLLHLTSAPDPANLSLLAQTVQVDPQIIDLLLHQNHMDRRLSAACRVVPPRSSSRGFLPDGEYQGLLDLSRAAADEDDLLLLNLWGESGLGQPETAFALASDMKRPLLVFDEELAGPEIATLLPLALRHAWLNKSLLCLSHSESSMEDKRLKQILSQAKGVIILITRDSISPSSSYGLAPISVQFAHPAYDERVILWRTALSGHRLGLEPSQIEALASRLRLSPKQIHGAVQTAVSQGRLVGSSPSFQDLLSAARKQTGRKLGQLARKTTPIHGWDDIILPDDSMRALQEICQRVRHRHQVLGEWGFHQKLALGKGTNALFSGPSGTGKTMAAGIVAGELGLDLYKIDLSGVVSKYIGETEKNLNQIFAAASHGNAILFFDEADALFGKRSEVRDSHDRYANIEISYLLQKMEEYDGVSILATNLRQHLDDSFLRRLAAIVLFPFPGENSRLLIWQKIWPAEIPLDDDIDLSLMARQFKLSGGNIKNVALAAAYLAASANSRVKMAHLLQATEREYQKMGRVLENNHLMHQPPDNALSLAN